MLRADRHLVADRFTAVGVPEAEIAGIKAGKDLAHEARIHRHGKVERLFRVPQHIHAVRNPDVVHQLADYARHGGHRDILHVREVWQGKLIGKHHGVHAAVL